MSTGWMYANECGWVHLWDNEIVPGHAAQAIATGSKDIAAGFKPALAAGQAGSAGGPTSVRECHHCK